MSRSSRWRGGGGSSTPATSAGASAAPTGSRRRRGCAGPVPPLPGRAADRRGEPPREEARVVEPPGAGHGGDRVVATAGSREVDPGAVESSLDDRTLEADAALLEDLVEGADRDA